eukprot:6619922-Lingulodinium_polyedra.AAC.1
MERILLEMHGAAGAVDAKDLDEEEEPAAQGCHAAAGGCHTTAAASNCSRSVTARNTKACRGFL